ncbi:YggT family protein [Tsuneonella suprasediminis]|uniref:YggT family protein n=1 Tax=Tsuneonella suprasediminis TaxID=2306996 RepID=A0A419R5R7_9SPHN|nr:YggT family protein [Tsuneonella suprasediminis]RJX71236.1 YggT family protein [Tsuneonella suprasediminis]UBS34484.1 YggT family protein [Altererythrobacter sp. N1]
MDALLQILSMLISTVNMLIIIWFIIGLLFAFNVIGRDNQFFVQVYDAISRLFEPVLAPIRRILPDTGSIDFSPMVLLMLLYAADILIRSAAGH